MMYFAQHAIPNPVEEQPAVKMGTTRNVMRFCAPSVTCTDIQKQGASRWFKPKLDYLLSPMRERTWIIRLLSDTDNIRQLCRRYY